MDPAERTAALFMETQLRVQTLLKDAVRAMGGLTVQQARALSFLRIRGPSALRDIADYQAVTPSAVSQFVDDLVAKGLVDRREDPEDRRRVLLALTPKGRRATETALKKFVGVISGAFRTLPAEDRAHLERGLEAVLREYDARGGFR